MDLEFDAVNHILGFKGNGSGVSKTLETVTLNQPEHLFGTPLGKNTDKQDIEIRNSLFNEKNFVQYWKGRNKKSDKNIKYGKINDLDGDNRPEFVAYYDDNGIDKIIGYNQYVITAPKSSQKNALAEYYSQGADKRKEASYHDFLMAHPALLDGWMGQEQINKIKDADEKKLITKVKKALASSSNVYNGIKKPKVKTEIANALITIATEAMIDDKANHHQAAVVKSLPGFVDLKKKFIGEDILPDQDFKSKANNIVARIISGDYASVEAYLERLADSKGKHLSAVNIADLYSSTMQRRYIRTREYKEADEAAYDTWRKDQYAGNYDPISKHNLEQL